MSRRNDKVYYRLNNIKDVEEPTIDEVKAILRAADEIIYSGGRSILAKILKGSRDKNILKYNLQECPSYGYFHNKTIDEITELIDWMILKDYLNIDYNGRLPMIVFSNKGWEIYKPVYANELYERILNVNEDDSISGLIEQLKQTNREVIIILLNNIGESKNIGCIRFLEKWKETEVKKVSKMINDALMNIRE